MRVVAAMHFVKEVNTLNIEVVILHVNNIWVVFKLLNVDYCDFWLATVVVNNLRGLDVFGKGFTTVNRMHDQSSPRKFPLSLDEQVQPVYDEVELGNYPFTLEVVR